MTTKQTSIKVASSKGEWEYPTKIYDTNNFSRAEKINNLLKEIYTKIYEKQNGAN
jgi:hypothetical protein